MQLISRPSYIECSFDYKSGNSLRGNDGVVEIFYARTKDLIVKYSDFKKYITTDEQIIAGKLKPDKNRETWVISHAVLRLVLAHCLRVNPLDLKFIKSTYNKPYLSDDPLFFNLAHTSEAFAFIISKNFPAGLDLEEINKSIEIGSISARYFSPEEHEFIFKSESGVYNRFFLIWTRKESLLKAIGTGIIDNLAEVEVSGSRNYLKMKYFDNALTDNHFSNFFLYSKQIGNDYLSIAIPQKSSIQLHFLNSDNIISFFN